MNEPKVLFILKGTQPDYQNYSSQSKVRPAGLANSARFVVDMLNSNDVVAKLVHVIDNNDIDREVSKYKPDVVIIEALWVVPEKFTILKKLHPNVIWIVRLHSELPFLALEGIAIGWIRQYVDQGVLIGVNSRRLEKDLMDADLAIPVYLPNYYPLPESLPPHLPVTPGLLFVGCFGAIRPLKNHLTQAIAAIQYADLVGDSLHFCINNTGADPAILKNLRALFPKDGTHQLIEIGWLPHSELLGFMATMDIHLQCSLSETFNITSADAVSVGVPIVVSPEVTWASFLSKANPNNVDSIFKGIRRILWISRNSKLLEKHNLSLLRKFDVKSEQTWLTQLKGL